jgi:hypothetical protein
MSLYGRIDRDVSSRPKETFEFLLVFTVCFVAMLFPAAIRWFSHRINGDETAARRSILGEAKAMAMNCAASAFMGM